MTSHHTLFNVRSNITNNLKLSKFLHQKIVRKFKQNHQKSFASNNSSEQIQRTDRPFFIGKDEFNIHELMK